MLIPAGRWTRVRLVVCGVVAGDPVRRRWASARSTLQVRDADRLRAMAEEQYLREIELPPRRGRILDRNGAELASTADVDSIYCNPRRLPDARDAARRLARALGLDRARAGEEAGPAAVLRVGQAQGDARRGRGGQGAGPARHRVHARAAALLSEPDAGGDGHGPRRARRGRAWKAWSWRSTRSCAGTSSSVQGMRDALGRDIARRGRRASGPSTAGSDVVPDHRSLPDLHHRARAGDGAAEHHAKGAIVDHDGPAHGRAAGDGVGPHLQPERTRRAPPNAARATAPSPTRSSPARR